MKDLELLSEWLDSKFSIAGFRFGLDGLIGLIPGVGDAATSLVSGYIIVRAAMAGAPAFVVVRMILNLLIESFVGLVPIVGNLFDFVWKANLKNINLMKAYQVDPSKTLIKSTGLIALVILSILVLFFGCLFLGAWLIYVLFGFVSSFF